MKEYVIPYCVGTQATWWAAVEVYNHSIVENAVEIRLQRHSNGVIYKIFKQKLDPRSHFTVLPDDINTNLGASSQGRATFMVIGPDDLMITGYQGLTDNSGLNDSI